MTRRVMLKSRFVTLEEERDGHASAIDLIIEKQYRTTVFPDLLK